MRPATKRFGVSFDGRPWADWVFVTSFRLLVTGGETAAPVQRGRGHNRGCGPMT